MASMRIPGLLVCLLLSGFGSVEAQPAKTSVADPTSDATLMAAGFLDGHPDLLYRTQGLDAYGRGEHAKAIERFRKAAYYGDKASQAIIGEMLWSGRGTAPDRIMALVWMDVAAERGYPRFVNTRNMYWNALSPNERQKARDLVDSVYAEYGDAATDPRLARQLRRARGKMTGSRLGSQTSPMQIVVPGHGSIEASRFYDPQFWEPDQYRAWHDAFWENNREGKVDVGAPEKVNSDVPTPPAPHPKQREPW